MGADRGLEHLAGKCHEAVLDGTKQRRRPFDKAADLVDQDLVRAQGRPGSRRQIGGPVNNGQTAFSPVHHDMAVAKPRDIVVGAADACQVDIPRTLEIMAPAYRGEGQCGPAKVKLPGKRASPEQQVDAVKRTHPAEPRAAPALTLRPREIGQNTSNHGRQQGGGVAPLFLDPGEQESALRRFLLDKLVAGETGRFHKPLDGFVRRVGTRAAPFLADIGLPFGDIIDMERQMARGHKTARGTMGKTGIVKPRQHHAFEVGHGARLHAGRNFLAEDLDQKVSHSHLPSRRPARSTPRSTRGPAPARGRYRRRARSPK